MPNMRACAKSVSSYFKNVPLGPGATLRAESGHHVGLHVLMVVVVVLAGGRW